MLLLISLTMVYATIAAALRNKVKATAIPI